jgi:hypothetical protein
MCGSLISPTRGDQLSQPYKTRNKITDFYTLIFQLTERRMEDERFLIERYQEFPELNLLLISSWTQLLFSTAFPKN